MSVLSLENRYYRLVSSRVEGDSGVFLVELLPQCTVYQGHFPGRPGRTRRVTPLAMWREHVGERNGGDEHGTHTHRT